MDSLTSRLMSQAGLNKAQPLLPPVHGMGVIYLKEELSQAEKDLHAARVALRDFKKKANDDTSAALYRAMAKLEKSEQDYFKRRYAGTKSTAVIHGWSNESAFFDRYDKRRDPFTLRVKQFTEDVGIHEDTYSRSLNRDKEVATAAKKALEAVLALEYMEVYSSVHDASQQREMVSHIDNNILGIGAIQVDASSAHKAHYDDSVKYANYARALADEIVNGTRNVPRGP